MARRIYHFPIVTEREKGGFSAHVIGLENIATAGPTLGEALKLATEAINLHLLVLSPDELASLDPYIQPPKELTTTVVSVSYPPENNG